jgi:hypothetical protein
MIVKLAKPIQEKTGSYASVCEPDKHYFVYAKLKSEGEEESYMINVYGGKTIYDIPAHYFTIVDDAIPDSWEEDSYDAYGKRVRIQSFPEMAHDEYFYDKLMNDNPETVTAFRVYADKYEEAAKNFKVLQHE